MSVETGVTHAERLARASEILIELFRSPVPTHFFQTLGDQAASAVPCDYLGFAFKTRSTAAIWFTRSQASTTGAPSDGASSLPARDCRGW